MIAWIINAKISVQVKMGSKFALRWNGADSLGAIKKMPCFVQESRKKWDKITWKEEIPEVKQKLIDPKDGEAEAKGVRKTHVKTIFK
jgi:hypothetical protein